jgi:hypothetical protein
MAGSILDILTEFTTLQDASDFLEFCWGNAFDYTRLPPGLDPHTQYNVTIANGSAFSFQFAELGGLPLPAFVSTETIRRQIDSALYLRNLVIGFSYFTIIFGK